MILCKVQMIRDKLSMIPCISGPLTVDTCCMHSVWGNKGIIAARVLMSMHNHAVADTGTHTHSRQRVRTHTHTLAQQGAYKGEMRTR